MRANAGSSSCPVLGPRNSLRKKWLAMIAMGLLFRLVRGLSRPCLLRCWLCPGLLVPVVGPCLARPTSRKRRLGGRGKERKYPSTLLFQKGRQNARNEKREEMRGPFLGAWPGLGVWPTWSGASVIIRNAPFHGLWTWKGVDHPILCFLFPSVLFALTIWLQSELEKVLELFSICIKDISKNITI